MLLEYCLGDLTHGGRGIGNRLESVLINPLARVLFDFEVEAGQSIKVERRSEDEDGLKVDLA